VNACHSVQFGPIESTTMIIFPFSLHYRNHAKAKDFTYTITKELEVQTRRNMSFNRFTSLSGKRHGKQYLSADLLDRRIILVVIDISVSTVTNAITYQGQCDWGTGTSTDRAIQLGTRRQIRRSVRESDVPFQTTRVDGGSRIGRAIGKGYA
jgi:hypothetical protein